MGFISTFWHKRPFFEVFPNENDFDTRGLEVLFGKNTNKHDFYLFVCFSFQILTAQFRQMDQELTEAVRLREEWAEQVRQGDAELSALREAALISQQQLEKEKMEVSRLEAELILMKEAELAAARAHQDASERDRAEITRLQSEIGEAESAREETMEQDRSEVNDQQKVLVNLREEQEGVKKKEELLAEIWSHLRSLAPETMAECDPADPTDPVDPALVLDSVRSVETQLIRLKDECGELSEQYAQLTKNMESLQGKGSAAVEG